jgi:hypothetical protein
MAYELKSPQARAPDGDSDKPGEIAPELLAAIPNGTIYSYNLDDGKTLDFRIFRGCDRSGSAGWRRRSRDERNGLTGQGWQLRHAA